MTVVDFIHEEVQHQGFDLQTRAGGRRVVWMTEAWDFARQEAEKRARPDLQDIRKELVPALMDRLWTHGDRLPALEFYKELEQNFDDPEFPPDLFDGGIP